MGVDHPQCSVQELWEDCCLLRLDCWFVVPVPELLFAPQADNKYNKKNQKTTTKRTFAFVDRENSASGADSNERPALIKQRLDPCLC